MELRGPVGSRAAINPWGKGKPVSNLEIVGEGVRGLGRQVIQIRNG